MNDHEAGNHEKLIHRYFDAVNTEDWSEFEKLWCDDAVLQAVGSRLRRGRDDVVAFYRRLFDQWTTHRDEPVRILPSGDSAAVEIRFTGTTRHGTPVEFDAVDIFDFADGAIARLTNWYDLVLVRDLLGGDAGGDT